MRCPFTCSSRFVGSSVRCHVFESVLLKCLVCDVFDWVSSRWVRTLVPCLVMLVGCVTVWRDFCLRRIYRRWRRRRSVDLGLFCTAERDTGVRFMTRFIFVTMLSLVVLANVIRALEVELLSVNGLSFASFSVWYWSYFFRRRCRKWLLWPFPLYCVWSDLCLDTNNTCSACAPS